MKLEAHAVTVLRSALGTSQEGTTVRKLTRRMLKFLETSTL